MSDDQKNPPAQPEFGELAPEGWSWNPEANAPHTPETKKAAEVAAKAAAKAKAAAAVATTKAADRQSDRRSTRQTSRPLDRQSTRTPEKPPAAAQQPATEKEPVVSSLTEDQKKARTVALARLASDRFITWGLLGVAIFSVVNGLSDYINLSRTLDAAFDQLNTMESGLNLQPYANLGLAKVLGWGIVMAQAIVIGLTFWWAVRRMRAGKLAFWVPVVGFAVSSAVVIIFMIFALVGDPTAWNTIVHYFQTVSVVTPTSTSTGTTT